MLAALLFAGCGADGNPCYGNNTCDPGLVCMRMGSENNVCQAPATIIYCGSKKINIGTLEKLLRDRDKDLLDGGTE
jgi:hypothetical protein